jgi:hypothetical protein
MFRRMMQKSYFPCQDGELDAAGGRGAGGVGVSRVWALFTGDSRVRAGTSTPGLGIFSSNHAMHSVDALTNPCAGAARRARGGRRRARVGRRHSPNGAGGRGARGGAGRAPPNPPPPPRGGRAGARTSAPTSRQPSAPCTRGTRAGASGDEGLERECISPPTLSAPSRAREPPVLADT